MTDQPKRVVPLPRNKLRHHEVDLEAPTHPGEPRRLTSSDHEQGLHEPVPTSRPRRPSRESAR
jgi:hypothetical protein